MNDKSAAQPEVIVVGGGWAGLSAAIELAYAGQSVMLLEAARQLGGRARCVRFGEQRLDNGQHLMIGAYREMNELLAHLGLKESQLFLRMPLELRFRQQRKHPLRMRLPRLISPLHLLIGLLGAKGPSWKDKRKTLRFCRDLQLEDFSLKQDAPVLDWLHSRRQPAYFIERLWAPLCLAALNTPVEIASTHLFLNVLKACFSGSRRHSDLLIPRTDLGTAFPQPAMLYIEGHKGHVELGQRVRELLIDNQRVMGVRTDQREIRANQVILATSPNQAAELLRPHAELSVLHGQLIQLQSAPICTIYLQYPKRVRLRTPLLGLLDGAGQWVFDRRVCNQPGLMAVIISGDGEHMAWDNDTLIKHITEQLAGHFPRWPTPSQSLVIREKRATFSASVNCDQFRPRAVTPVQGLVLAGDYTQTDLPATLEGAIKSGRHAAQILLNQQQA